MDTQAFQHWLAQLSQLSAKQKSVLQRARIKGWRLRSTPYLPGD